MTDYASPLLDPIKLGAIDLPNRIIMAPLTRMRADANGVPGALMAEQYAQRASAGLIIAEATSIAPNAYGVPNQPGIHTAEQIAGWRRVTDAVHAKGGRIVLQIVHGGRASHSSLSGGERPIAPSEIAAPGGTYSPQYQPVEYEVPRALSVAEIPAVVALFAQAARNAHDAGFDGVEIHGANGYLIDEFLQDVSNTRTDDYGGSFDNRARFLLEVVDAVIAAVGADRVGLRLSPWSTYNGMSDSDPKALFSAVIAALNDRRLAYLHMPEGRASEVGMADNILQDMASNAETFSKLFDGPFITAGGYTPQTGARAIAAGHAAAVGFGRIFVANPDLVARIETDAPLNAHDRATFYGGAAEGYTDYPVLTSELSAAQ
uniref:NADH:flavin oxidoreductase/NADH oxidase n=1 Tax=Caulobacter sp. (strain K31) TaxID=366602 RepID=B0T978_CAUSK